MSLNYTEVATYHEVASLASHLRGNKIEQEDVANLKSLWDKFSMLEPTGPLYRGMSIPTNAGILSLFQNSKFTVQKSKRLVESWSTDPNIALGFSKNSVVGVVLKQDTYDLSRFVFYYDEDVYDVLAAMDEEVEEDPDAPYYLDFASYREFKDYMEEKEVLLTPTPQGELDICSSDIVYVTMSLAHFRGYKKHDSPLYQEIVTALEGRLDGPSMEMFRAWDYGNFEEVHRNLVVYVCRNGTLIFDRMMNLDSLV